ncbi:MAG TPA: Holliday junction branch migration protein RuvA, partial [Saprospiraceae bacterium]|nr:Holliday junction branch migration protein RuvA [Saprospiraceae bacterium]
MISYLKGNITFKSPSYIIVETAGVGYKVNITLHTYSQIEQLEQIKILTYLHIKEDSHTLYGFAKNAERSLFKHLISVSGIGPNTARVLLSSMQPEEARQAIITENVLAFKKVKGIGPKTAKRIILDLKDKMIKESGDAPVSMSPQDNTFREEALSALVALGFVRIKVQKTLNSILKGQNNITSVEELIKIALK